MKTKVKKQKIMWQQYIGVAFLMLIGAVCGVLLAKNPFTASAGDSFGEKLIGLGLLLVGMYIIVFLQLIIHEAGHLLFGLLTGYRYVSFRIGSFMWQKENGRIRFRKLSIAGTGGQCLMCPPDMVDGKIPFVLYNLGGSLLNILSGVLFLVAYQLFKGVPYLSVFLLIGSIVGFAYALMNGIPMRLGMVDNDGYNTLSLGKNPEALRSFWVQIKVNEQMSKGVRLKDMPEEWFAIPTEEGMKNSMTAVMGVFAANRLMDLHDFIQAKELMERLLHLDSAIVGLHRSLMTCDLIYCALIGGSSREQVDAMLDKQQRKFMKRMRKFPAVLRTAYAYALIAEKNDKKAKHAMAEFEACALSYPYQSDIESERELILIAEKEVR